MKKILLILPVLAILFSCENDPINSINSINSNEKIAKLTNDDIEISLGLKHLRREAFEDSNLGGQYHYSPDAGLVISDDMFKGKTTSNIVIPPHALTDRDNNEINGYIYVDYVEVFTIDKMVSLNTPTMGINHESGERELLVSGGEFYLMIRDSSGNVVNLNQPIQVNIATNNSQANPNGMLLWNGVTDPDGSFWWNDASTSDISFPNGSPVFLEGNYYNVLIKTSSSFGWYNCDRFVNDPRPKSDIQIQIPSNFNQSNSSVYIAFEGEKNALMHLSSYDANLGMFGTGFPSVPDGSKAHIIFVGEQNGHYEYEIITTTITGNPVFAVNAGNLNIANNFQQLEDQIKLLP